MRRARDSRKHRRRNMARKALLIGINRYRIPGDAEGDEADKRDETMS
jgi:hypothetical protein